jgi:hypothetical protein
MIDRKKDKERERDTERGVGIMPTGDDPQFRPTSFFLVRIRVDRYQIA